MLQGCTALVAAGAGAAAGAGTVAYVEGELQSTYVARLDRTWNAAMAALQDLELGVKTADKDAAGGTIGAMRTDQTPVKLTLKAAGPGTTSVKIRVGTFGDEEVSMAIHHKIAAHLGTLSG
jgi:hypothetical protein